MKQLQSFLALVLLSVIGSAAFAADQAWEYKLSGTSPTSGTQRPTSGVNKAELFEKNGVYTFRLRGNTAPFCYLTEGAAEVVQDDKTITITPEPRMANCERIRLVIKKDGSGGVQQQLSGKAPGQQWQDEEGKDYGLTPR